MLAPFRSRGLTPYLVGIAGIVVASGLRFLLDPFLGDHLSFSFHFLAVSVAAWTGGVWPAVFTAVISAIVGDLFFSDPYLSLQISGSEELVNLVFFIFVSVVIGILSEISLRALSRAKKAEEEKDNFMATVAHELRSPISVIHNANWLSRLEGSERPSDRLDMIDRQVNHLNLIIEDLLDVSRVARGKIRLNRQQISAVRIIAGAVEKARPLIDKHRHNLSLRLSPEPMPIFVDPARMEQVIANLLTNAAKYTPDGGEITLRAEPVGDSLAISVRDNGIGIKAEVLPQVFDLFVQAEAARGREEGGLGIGLALARKIAEMHGGTVRAESAGPDQGSEFLVTVPLAQPVIARLQSVS